MAITPLLDQAVVQEIPASTTLTLAMPAGLLAGDVLVVFMALGWNQTVNNPSGWEQRHQVHSHYYDDDDGEWKYNRLETWVHVVGPGDPPTYTWNNQTDCPGTTATMPYRGVDVNNILIATNGSGNYNRYWGLTWYVNNPGINVSRDSAYVVTAWSHPQPGELDTAVFYDTPDPVPGLGNWRKRCNVPRCLPGWANIAGIMVSDAPCNYRKIFDDGVIYVRSRMRRRPYGVAVVIVLWPAQRAPLQPGLGPPANGIYTDLSGPQTFAWQFLDPDTGDQQTAWAFRRKTGSASYAYWSDAGNTWVASEIWNTGTVSAKVFPAGQWANGSTYQWSVRTKDLTGLIGPYAPDITITGSTPPAVTVTGPTGQNAVSQPTVTWNYTDAQNDAQVTWQVKVFGEDVTSLTGFDPNTATAWWDSGLQVGSDRSARIATDLITGPWRAYVRAGQIGGQTSAWAYSEFTDEIIAPEPPTLTAAVGAAVVLTMNANDNGDLYSARNTSFRLEYSLDNGDTWATVRGAGILAVDSGTVLSTPLRLAQPEGDLPRGAMPRSLTTTAAAALSGTARMPATTGTGIYFLRATFSAASRMVVDTVLYPPVDWVDLVAAPNTIILYRAFVVGSVAGALITSPPSEPVAVYLPVQNWRLIDADDGTILNLLLAAPATYSRDESLARFTPLGRPDPIIVADVVHTLKISLSMLFIDTPDYDAFQDLRSRQKTIILQSSRQEQWWVRIGEQIGTSELHRQSPFDVVVRTVSISMDEVTAP